MTRLYWRMFDGTTQGALLPLGYARVRVDRFGIVLVMTTAKLRRALRDRSLDARARAEVWRWLQFRRGMSLARRRRGR